MSATNQPDSKNPGGGSASGQAKSTAVIIHTIKKKTSTAKVVTNTAIFFVGLR